MFAAQFPYGRLMRWSHSGYRQMATSQSSAGKTSNILFLLVVTDAFLERCTLLLNSSPDPLPPLYVSALLHHKNVNVGHGRVWQCTDRAPSILFCGDSILAHSLASGSTIVLSFSNGSGPSLSHLGLAGCFGRSRFLSTEDYMHFLHHNMSRELCANVVPLDRWSAHIMMEPTRRRQQ